MPGRTFFLPSDEAQKLRIGQAGVPYVDFSIGDEAGLLVEEDNLQRMLDALELQKTGETASLYEGILRLSVGVRGAPERPSDGGGKVVIGDWNGKKSEAFKKAAEVLLPILSKAGLAGNVVISVPHGKNAPPLYNSDFNIFIWSSPIGANLMETRPKMWDVKVDCTDGSFAPSGQGVAIVDDAGACVAELVGRCNLYIHHDICHNGTANEVKIFGKILDEAVSLVTLTDEEIAERLRRRMDAERNKARQAYIQYAAGSLQSRFDSLQKSVNAERQKVEAAQKSLAEAIRRVKEHEEALELLVSSRAKQEQELGDEYDRLVASRSITDVAVNKEKVTVTTEVLYCVHPVTQKRHKIGAFRIELFLDGREDCVRMYNQTHKVYNGNSNMNAPHVDTNGKPCLGTLKYDLPKAIGRFDFNTAIMMCITFLEAVNLNDNWGRQIDRWPVE